MHHDPDNQRGAHQHDGQHWETGDGCQLPHIRRLIHRFTYRLNKKNLKLRHWKEGYHRMRRSFTFSVSDSFTVLHVLHDGVFGYCLHDAHGTQTSKSEFQNSELPHWPAHRKTSSSSVSYASLISSVSHCETKLDPGGFMSPSRAKHFSGFMKYLTLLKPVKYCDVEVIKWRWNKP